MKLTGKNIANLDTILGVCSLVGIDNIIIEDGRVSGVNEDRSCAIFSNNNVPEIGEHTKMGLSRLSTLQTRMSVFRTDPKVSIEAKENGKSEISHLEISGTNAKVQFRCTASSLIKAPKSINTEALKKISIQKEQLPLILSGAKAMGAKKLTIAVKAKEMVSFEFTDMNQDAFTITLNNPAIHCGEEASEMCVNYYPAEVLLPLLREAANSIAADGEIIVTIGVNGVAQLEVNGHLMTVISQIDA